jgi:hypothetical protein
MINVIPKEIGILSAIKKEDQKSKKMMSIITTSIKPI